VTVTSKLSAAGGHEDLSPLQGQGRARPAIVTAVLVVHNGLAWLGDCLEAISAQARPPDRLVIVDTGSTSTGVAATTCTNCAVQPEYMTAGAVDQHQTASSQYGSGS